MLSNESRDFAQLMQRLQARKTEVDEVLKVMQIVLSNLLQVLHNGGIDFSSQKGGEVSRCWLLFVVFLIMVW